MITAPIGIFALISSTISNLGVQIILPLLKYLTVYAFATLLFLLLWILFITLYARVNPLRLVKKYEEYVSHGTSNHIFGDYFASCDG